MSDCFSIRPGSGCAGPVESHTPLAWRVRAGTWYDLLRMHEVWGGRAMVIDTKTRKKSPRDRWRFPYHFTAAQVMKMIEFGIVDDSEDVELWDGMLYKMVKGELHNYIVSQAA